ncbi:hypothetical protein [Flavobacterium sp.]|jgi:hypothetical protein|uniref:hypothetical protein n=1 Tax=Flavobacterium sp. TaxID=239 RepID=UPI0037C0AEC6
MENKIRIQNPCNENWSSMSTDKKGRFCTSCNKIVIDFRKMKAPEIQKYFVENSTNESICGYYKFNQVENENNTKYTNLKNRFNQIKVKPIKIVALLSLSFLFSFSSCFMGKRAEDQSEDSIENDSVTTNKIKDSIQKDSIKDRIDTLKK